MDVENLFIYEGQMNWSQLLELNPELETTYFWMVWK